jgi:hypothetical protein
VLHDRGDQEQIGDHHGNVDVREVRDHPVVHEPVVRDHREGDPEGDQLGPDVGVERAQALPGAGGVAHIDGGHQQGQREREGGVEERDRPVELGLVPRVAHAPSLSTSGLLGGLMLLLPAPSDSGITCR